MYTNLSPRRDQLDAARDGSDTVQERTRASERRGSSRPRGESGAASNPRPTDEPRRRRGVERRYVGWGDGVERAYCLEAIHLLPTAFPVSSRTGVATISTVVVARRVDALLLCDFSHDGDHFWPDGEMVDAGGPSRGVEESRSREEIEAPRPAPVEPV